MTNRLYNGLRKRKENPIESTETYYEEKEGKPNWVNRNILWGKSKWVNYILSDHIRLLVLVLHDEEAQNCTHKEIIVNPFKAIANHWINVQTPQRLFIGPFCSVNRDDRSQNMFKFELPRVFMKNLWCLAKHHWFRKIGTSESFIIYIKYILEWNLWRNNCSKLTTFYSFSTFP